MKLSHDAGSKENKGQLNRRTTSKEGSDRKRQFMRNLTLSPLGTDPERDAQIKAAWSSQTTLAEQTRTCGGTSPDA